jgi:AcrR family transcriptional regulator
VGHGFLLNPEGVVPLFVARLASLRPGLGDLVPPFPALCVLHWNNGITRRETPMSDPNLSTHSTTSSELRDRIRTAARLTFDARGYAATSVEEICSEACLDMATVTALFPTKYDLFREGYLGAARDMLAATEPTGHVPTDSRQARAALIRMLDAYASVNIARGEGGFVRGESRYLTAEDRAELHRIAATIRNRVVEPLRRYRPELSESDATLLAIAALSTVASILSHPTTLPKGKIHTLLTVSAMRLLESESALSASGGHFIPKQIPEWKTDTSVAGRILAAAIPLIHQRGFLAVTFADIAAESGIPVAEIGFHYASTATLLQGAFHTGQRMLGDAMRKAAEFTTPRDILLGLSHAYVEHFFTHPELMTIFILDARHLPAAQYAETARLQREFAAGWVAALSAMRPELAHAEASFLVFAALSIVADLGAATQWEYVPATMATVEQLVVATLVGGR